jgi:hypothetical protein
VKNDAQWFDSHKKLVIKPAKQETRAPESATLFIKRRSGKTKEPGA